MSPKINQSPFLLKRQWSAWKPQSRCTFLFLEVSSKPCYYAVYSFPLPKIYNLPFIITQNLISNLIIHFIKVNFWTAQFGLAIALLIVSNNSKCNGKPKFCDHSVFFFGFGELDQNKRTFYNVNLHISYVFIVRIHRVFS